MRALPLYIFIFQFLFACLYAFGSSVASLPRECGIEQVRIKFSDLSFDGPLSVDLIKSFYEERFSNGGSEVQSEEWVKFIKLASIDGCIYSFSSDENSWYSLSGVKGYAFIENGEVISMIITKKS